MRPLYIHPWVFSWVFDNLMSNPFHPDFLLPIHFFQSPFIIRAETRFYNSYVSTILNSQCEGHNHLLPAYSHDNITVGYSICFASDSEKQANRTNRVPFFPPFISRIVLDHNTNRLMFFIPSNQVQLVAILVYSIQDSSQYTFMIPAKDYDWDSLPDDPLVAFQASGISPNMINVNGTLPTYEIPHNGINHVNDIDLTPRDVAELMSSLSTSTTTNSNTVITNTTLDHVTPFSNTIATAIRQNRWSNSIFGMNCYQAIKNLTPTTHLLKHDQWTKFHIDACNILNGLTVYFGNRIDENPIAIPGYDYIGQKRRHHYIFEKCERTVSQAIGPKSAHVYYSSMLSLTPDRPLLQNQLLNQSDETVLRLECDRSDSPENTSRPRHIILEERRKRNRLSAERSNAKKREKLKKMKFELETSKVRITELRKRQMEELQRNQQLRSMINMTWKCS